MISSRDAQKFMDSITETFPSCIAAVLSDNDGLLISHKCDEEHEFDETLLAIQAITDRNIVNLKKYTKYRKSLASDLNLLLVARRDRYNLVNYNRLTKILEKSIKPF